ncbi:MAG: SUMF1/EgtB/PvdO family nonheme iron enzyme [Duncaniella sp.]|nr:SUMF1/EgtB/PvdO family nonheme iron enzyme [Duncaniella sp.]MDE6813701.1 SUMF1/EgtB/PvdO family nonheme iron enzyme [Duncaniella sp.]
MKKIICFLLCAIAFCGCSKNDDEVNFTLSATDLTFEVEGGEQVVNIVTDGKYDCSYSEDWITIRQQKDKIRVIVDKNETEVERTAFVSISCNGEPRQQIKITQNGIQFQLETSSFNVPAKENELMIPVTSNTKFSFDCKDEWLEITSVIEGLKIMVSRNYKMSGRCGRIILYVGNTDKEISINQEASTWFESFEMVKVDGGTFFMGAQKNDANGQNYDANAYAIESPVHQVTVSSFAIGKFEVTQEQWEAAMGNNPSKIVGTRNPVENVTWEEVQAFFAVLNQASGLKYRLPSEAEWEFAAKGGNKSNGYVYSGYPVIGACAWYYSNSNSTTHEVGMKESNELGIFDMSGNVREWCVDWFEYYISSSVENPQGPYSGNMKINRGGSWTTPYLNCRNSYRHTDYPDEAAQDLGFRIVLVE